MRRNRFLRRKSLGTNPALPVQSRRSNQNRYGAYGLGYKRTRDLALFDLAIDSKLRGCDLVRLKIGDIALHGAVQSRATVIQRKTGRPVQFELTEQTRASVRAWLQVVGDRSPEYLFPSRVDRSGHVSTRQYARLVDRWTSSIGL